MGDANQYEWVKKHADRVEAPILEIGSKNYGSVSYDYRGLFVGRGAYVGADMSPGDGVDVVADLTADFDCLPESLRTTRFGAILCLSVMEHVRDIYRFALNLRQLLAADGVAFVSVPWVWRFHGYPSDYWRFSPEALRFLLAPLQLDETASCISHQQLGSFNPLCHGLLNTYPDYAGDTAPASRAGRWIVNQYQRLAQRFAPRMGRSKRQVLYPTMINAVFRPNLAA
jgi:SAM-dependent methyltransferase